MSFDSTPNNSVSGSGFLLSRCRLRRKAGVASFDGASEKGVPKYRAPYRPKRRIVHIGLAGPDAGIDEWTSCTEASVLFLCAAQGDQHVEQPGQALLPGAAGGEAGGDVVDRQRDGAGGEQVGDGAHLVHGVL